MAQESTPNPFMQNDTGTSEGKITFLDDTSKQATSPGHIASQTPVVTQTDFAKPTMVNDDFNALVRSVSQSTPQTSQVHQIKQAAESSISRPNIASPFMTSPASEQELLQNQSLQQQIPELDVADDQLAGFWVRYAAIFIDSIILFIISTVLQYGLQSIDTEAFSNFGRSGLNMLFAWMYSCGFLYLWQGETPGKRVLGIRVVSSDQSGLSLGRIILRETLGKFLSAILFGIGYFMMPFTKRKQALHDKLAGTFVVYTDNNNGKKMKYIVFAVIGAIVALIALIVGSLSSFVLLSLGDAREKAQDAKMKSLLSSTSIEAILYTDTHESFVGFVPTALVSIPECSGQPKINIAPHGESLAVFVKSCTNPKSFICSDVFIDAKTHIVDVNPAIASSGAFTCGSIESQLESSSPELLLPPDTNISQQQINSDIPQSSAPLPETITGAETVTPSLDNVKEKVILKENDISWTAGNNAKVHINKAQIVREGAEKIVRLTFTVNTGEGGFCWQSMEMNLRLTNSSGDFMQPEKVQPACVSSFSTLVNQVIDFSMPGDQNSFDVYNQGRDASGLPKMMKLLNIAEAGDDIVITGYPQ